MPIKPENKKKYPADWKAIVSWVRLRSKNRCECTGECGLHHEHRCEEKNGEPAKWAKGKIVLTAAHLCHDESCRNFEHIKHMCQRCHLRYDSKHHQENAAKTRHNKKAIGDLFEIGTHENK